MYKITKCDKTCECVDCTDSCEFAGRRADEFAVVRESCEIYSSDEYLETPIPANIAPAV